MVGGVESVESVSQVSFDDADERVTKAWVMAQEKCELHLHLGGSWPLDFLQHHAKGDAYKKIQSFMQNVESGVTYEQVFGIFPLLRSIVTTNALVKEGTIALIEQLAADNVGYAEIRTGIKSLGGEPMENYLLAVLEGMEEAERAYGVETRLLLSLKRFDTLEHALATVELANRYRDRGVCAIDISDKSTKGDLTLIREAIEKAHQYKIPFSLHIGEAHDETPEQQIRELELVRPSRVGHCACLGVEALKYIRENQVPVEVCLKSSKFADMVADDADHPMLKLIDEHPIAFCTDDHLFGITLSDELHRAAEILDWDRTRLKRCIGNSFAFKLGS